MSRRLVRDVVALMAAGCGGRDIEVKATVAADVPPALVCDATRLRQVLINLVGNAVKFTEAGSVEASLAFDPADGGRLQVAVRDTGVGIPEAAKRHLFQRFAQVDSAATRMRGGTGLGLAISRQLVELMGGEISVESVPGLGSTFRFWVPAPASDAAPPAAGERHRRSGGDPVDAAGAGAGGRGQPDQPARHGGLPRDGRPQRPHGHRRPGGARRGPRRRLRPGDHGHPDARHGRR